jgi:hypothetical protein
MIELKVAYSKSIWTFFGLKSISRSSSTLLIVDNIRMYASSVFQKQNSKGNPCPPYAEWMVYNCVKCFDEDLNVPSINLENSLSLVNSLIYSGFPNIKSSSFSVLILLCNNILGPFNSLNLSLYRSDWLSKPTGYIRVLNL